MVKAKIDMELLSEYGKVINLGCGACRNCAACESCDNVTLAIVLMGIVEDTHQFVGLLVELKHNWCNKFGTNQFTSTSTSLTGATLQFAPKVLGNSLPGLADTLFCWSLVRLSLLAFVFVGNGFVILRC